MRPRSQSRLFLVHHTLPELAQISASFLPHRTILFCTGLLSSWNNRLLTFHQLSFSYRHCHRHHGSHCHSNIHGMVGSRGDDQGTKHEVWMVECDITITVIFVTVWTLLKQWSTDYSVCIWSTEVTNSQPLDINGRFPIEIFCVLYTALNISMCVHMQLALPWTLCR